MKKLFLISFLLLPLLIFAQNSEIKHYYVDSVGNLFWNRHTPVYLRMSASPNDAGILLENSPQENYSNPFYLDSEGKNFIRKKWAVNQDNKTVVLPKMEITWEVWADGAAPVSRYVSHRTPKISRADGTVIFGDGLSIELLSTDASSGVHHINYQINDHAFKIYSDVINFREQGSYSLKFSAIDNVNNKEPEKTLSFEVDTEVPITECTYKQVFEENILSKNSVIELKSTDNKAGVREIYYKLNNNEFVPYKQPLNFKTLQDGWYTLQYYAIDSVENKETIREKKFYLDKLAPILAADILGDRFIVKEQVYFSGRTKLKLTAVDNKAGIENVYYSIDNDDFKIYSQPFYLPSQPGYHLVQYYAIDKVGNRTADSKDITHYEQFTHVVSKIYVDLTGPDLDYRILGPRVQIGDSVFISRNSKIAIEANDGESGLQYTAYSLNSARAETQYKTPFSIGEHGKHHIEIFGYDNVKNRNQKTFAVFVDARPPEIFYYFSNEPIGAVNGVPLYPDYVSIRLAATDQHTGANDLFYQLNGGAEQKFRDRIKPDRRKGLNSLKIKAIDKLGNESSTKIEFYIIDN